MTLREIWVFDPLQLSHNSDSHRLALCTCRRGHEVKRSILMNLLANSEWLWAGSLFTSVQFKGDSYVKNPFMDRFCEFCYQAFKLYNFCCKGGYFHLQVFGDWIIETSSCNYWRQCSLNEALASFPAPVIVLLDTVNIADIGREIYSVGE